MSDKPTRPKPIFVAEDSKRIGYQVGEADIYMDYLEQRIAELAKVQQSTKSHSTAMHDGQEVN